MDQDKLKETIQTAEGLKLKPYEDTTGHLTVGWGHNLSAKGISPVIADWLLHDDLMDATTEIARAWPPFGDQDDVRQRAIVEMTFNLGLSGVLEFRSMLHALAARDFSGAAAAVLDSRAAQQAPSRYHRLSVMIETGEDV